MIPIRIKIIFLAFFALILLSFMLFREYSNDKLNLMHAENSFESIDKIIELSKVIHTLQKERGLSIAMVSKGKSSVTQKLNEQRNETDKKLKELETQRLFEDLHQEFLKKLPNIRDAINKKTLNWYETKEFYTQQIDESLITILTLLNTFEQNKIHDKLNALIQLAYARENLGLLRATITRYYQKGNLNQTDLIEINKYFVIFQNRLKFFYFYMQNNELDKWKSQIQSNIFDSVIEQVNNISDKVNIKEDATSNLWWQESTFIIDTMKNMEIAILEEIKKYLELTIQESKTNLIIYILCAITGLLVIAIITILTVLRILKALSVLINSLRQVESNQDFGIRIKIKNNDEFGQLSLSINNLLTFTDTIIKEKDTLASIDLLTGVMNRRSFIYSADKEIARSKRYETPLSLIFCDIDKFKSINDTYGHAIGDEVLKLFASTLKNNLRENDILTRWGGEEFMILTVETNIDQAAQLAEKLRNIIMKIDVPSVKQITCSFGVAQLKKGETLEQLCEKADQAVYEAKNSGRNKVVKKIDS